MDVTILEAPNAPSKPVVALHVGSVRRQVRMEVNRTFQIPHPGALDGRVQLTLFQQMASQALLVDDGSKESYCSIKVPSASGEANGSEVTLRIRRYNEGAEGPRRPQGADKLEDARDYLNKHQLQQRIQNLIQDVLKAQPDDPYRYMLQSLKSDKAMPATQPAVSSQARELPAAAEPPAPAPPPAADKPAEALAAGTDAKASAVPLVPKPPEKPRTSDGSPRRAQNVSKSSPEKELDSFGVEGEAKVALEASAASNRSEARSAARTSIRMIFAMPKVNEEAARSFREKAQRDLAASKAGLVVDVVKKKLLDRVVQGQDPRHQARASILMMLQSAAPKCTPEYHRALARWTTASLFRCASNCIKDGDPTRKKECFSELATENHRQLSKSMPKPIVFLDAGGGSWGSWLNEDKPKTPKTSKARGRFSTG